MIDFCSPVLAGRSVGWLVGESAAGVNQGLMFGSSRSPEDESEGEPGWRSDGILFYLTPILTCKAFRFSERGQ